MAIELPVDPDTGKLRPFTEEEIEAMDIRTRGIADGSHPTHAGGGGRARTLRAEYRVAFDQFDNFLIHMLGAVKTYTDPDLNIELLSRLPPQSYPGRPRMVCMQLEEAHGAGAAGMDDEDGAPEYPDMDVTLVFEAVMFDTDVTDDETSHEYQRFFQRLPTTWEASYLSLPGGILHYIKRPTDANPTGGAHLKPVQHNVGVPRMLGIVSRKWWHLPASVWNEGSKLYRRFYGDPEAETPDDESKPYVGTVNHAPLLGYPAGTMLLLPPEEEIIPDPFGTGEYVNLTLRWQFDAQGMNYFRFFDPANPEENGVYMIGKGAEWYPSDTLPDNYSLFDARDHKRLFMVGDPPP